MIIFDESTGLWYDTDTGRRVEAPPAPVDHSQNPLIGVALLVLAFWLVYILSGSPQIVWVP